MQKISVTVHANQITKQQLETLLDMPDYLSMAGCIRLALLNIDEWRSNAAYIPPPPVLADNYGKLGNYQYKEAPALRTSYPMPDDAPQLTAAERVAMLRWIADFADAVDSSFTHNKI